MTEANDFAGLNGFVWWIGIVEDRKDPLKLGRCKVRIFGWHSDKLEEAPVDSLPWAQAMMPLNNANTYTPKESDMVVGFFLDGKNGQEPVMMGVLPGIPLRPSNNQQGFNDIRKSAELNSAPVKPTESKTGYPRILDEPTTSRIARNDSESIGNTFIQRKKDDVITGISGVNSSWSEPTTQYSTVYPYNNVIETESGHIMEFDDTPEKERIHIAHRDGSFQEWFPDGDKVEKIVKDNYEIVVGNDRLYVKGKCQITVDGDAEVYVKSDAYMKVDGKFDAQIGSTCRIESGGTMTFVAPKIDLNP